MADPGDFLPIDNETVASIRARVDADINAGLTPADPDYVDMFEGGFAWDVTQALILEIARLRDLLATEAVAATFPTFAWGDYLDEHGETIGVTRKPAAKATGAVTFSTSSPAPADILIPTGTEIATSQQHPDDDPIVFVTTVDATLLAASSAVTVNVEADIAGADANVSAGQVNVLQSPVAGIAAVSNAAATSGGAEVESDEAFRLRILTEFAGASGAGTQADYRRWALSYPGVGFATVQPIAFGPGTVNVVITDTNNRPFSTNAVPDALQSLLDPPSFITETVGSHALPVATLNVVATGGADTVGKVVVLSSAGPQVIAYTGKTGTTFTGCTGGTGTVAAATLVKQGGKGAGLAPIGAVVIVTTPVLKAISVAAAVVPHIGYSMDGTGGTVALRPDVVAALTDYIDRLLPGDDVILNHVIARFFAVNGVDDVNSVTLNGSAGNIVVGPSEVAYVSSTAGIV